MDLRDIKQIVDLMKKSDLTEFEIEQEGLKLKIRRASSPPPAPSSGSSAAPFVELTSAAAPVTPTLAPPPPAPSTADESGVSYVVSPMVGTFYRAPSPESPPFVDVGTKVQEKTPVCIIEAMKIMNEILAEVRGTIVEILVENGQPVEYGQKLFKVRIG